MKYSLIKKCTICDSKIKSENKISFKKFPISEIYLNKPYKKKAAFDQQINFCKY